MNLSSGLNKARILVGAPLALAVVLAAVLSPGAAKPATPTTTVSLAHTSLASATAPTTGSLMTAYVGAGDPSGLQTYTNETGLAATYAVDYFDDSTWTTMANPWSINQWAGSGYQMVWGVPMLPVAGGATLAAGATGAYNSYFTTLAQNLVAAGMAQSTLRIGWEFNETAFPWYAAGQASSFVAYWRQIVTAMRAVPGANFQFEWNPLLGDGSTKDAAMGDLSAYYPGDDVVDVVGLDVYDEAYNTYPGATAEFQSIDYASWGLSWLASFGAAHNKPIAIPEMGLGQGPSAPNSGPVTGPGEVSGGDDPTFIADMASWVAQNNVIEVGYWDSVYSSIEGGQNPLTAAALRTDFATDAAETSTGAAYTLVTPALSTMTPASGTLNGGATVTMIGVGLGGGPTTVTFGGVAAKTFTTVNANEITAMVPAGTAGSTPATIVTPWGSTSLPYTRYVVPVTSSLTPANGPLSGGIITLTGTGFTGTTAVNFGTIAATSFSVNSDTQITATVPTGPAGSVQVAVVTPGGTASLQYTRYVAPTASAMTPITGPLTGGAVVTITGTGFTGTTTVTFGGVAAKTFTVVSSTQITAMLPAGPAGTVPVIATTPGGTTTAFQYTRYVVPVTSSLTPANGPLSGGIITLTGTGFTGTTAVNFGTIAATSFSVNSDTQITATVPTGPAGSVQVAVVTPGGTASLQYTRYVAPTASAMTPITGPLTGGAVVTITGTGFTGTTTVTFGGVAAKTFTVVSSTQITAMLPAGPAGTVPVIATTPGGTTTAFQYTRYVVPVTSSLTPANGPLSGGIITLTGTGFTGTTAVNFGTIAATSFSVNSDTQITATVPTGPAGSVQVAVVTPGGTASLQYTRYVAPTASAMTPITGPLTGGAVVTITGTGFTGTTTVTFGGVAAKTFTVVSSTQITAMLPAGPAGTVPVIATTPGGTTTGLQYTRA